MLQIPVPSNKAALRERPQGCKNEQRVDGRYDEEKEHWMETEMLQCRGGCGNPEEGGARGGAEEDFTEETGTSESLGLGRERPRG